MPRATILVVAALGLAAYAVVAPTPVPPPAHVRVPAIWPAAHLVPAPAPGARHHRICVVDEPAPTITDRHQLPTHSTGADLLWYPGLNAGTPGGRTERAPACRTWHTTLDATATNRLLHDLAGLPYPGGGSYNCPGDDYASVEVWFHARHGSLTFPIGLVGCAFDRPRTADLGTWPHGMPDHR